MSDALSRPRDSLPMRLVDGAPAPIQPLLRLMRLDRPIGGWLLFWPCIFGMALGAAALHRPFLQSGTDWWRAALMAAGTLVMRGAGCTFNDIVDRDIDAKVARTAGRPIPSGAISARSAAGFLIAQLLAGLLILLQFNRFAVIAGASSLLLVAAYPFMKRITWWPQAWLGLTFNWGVLVGCAAMTGTITAPALIAYAAAIFWTLGYDTIYALQDVEDDALIGVKSTARLFGHNAPRWVLGFYVMTLALLAAAGWAAGFGWISGLLLACAGAHLLWQVSRIRPEDADICLRLFRANRDTGALIALALAAGSWQLHF